VNVVYKWWSALMLLVVLLQIGFAGYGAFYVASKLDGEGTTVDEDAFIDGFGIHAGVGYLVILLGLIFLLIGVVAGIGKWRLGKHGLLFGLLFIQLWLAWIGFEVPAIGFFHPVNAVLIAGLAAWIVWEQWIAPRRAAVAVTT
jgi:hypothetical protein